MICLLQVIADCLSEEEIAGLKEMFKMIDTDNSGQITYEELKVGFEKAGAILKESEIYDLMQAVSTNFMFIWYEQSVSLLKSWIKISFLQKPAVKLIDTDVLVYPSLVFNTVVASLY